MGWLDPVPAFGPSAALRHVHVQGLIDVSPKLLGVGARTSEFGPLMSNSVKVFAGL